MCPSTPKKVRLKTREPIRMKSTKDESLVVESSAWRTIDQFSRRLTAASASAPTAPIAPPSVGVASPMKIVPSTRKISTSGGISATTTRIASCGPWMVRNSFGNAGADFGKMMVIPMT